MTKPSLPQGTRDFAAATVYKRNYILNTIRSVFELHGFEPLETPAMENLETLMGKYGEEGDKLIFKILNNGLNDPKNIEKANDGFAKLMEGKNTAALTERALKYDLTIPFARFVAMNANTLTMPYKRYQMQQVWRADRPQKGRYREFTQCDADVVGSTSLINEVEFILLIDRVYEKLFNHSAQSEENNVTIQINNRKIWAGIAELCGCPNQIVDITVALDKYDKIGIGGVKVELISKGFNEDEIINIFQCLFPADEFYTYDDEYINSLELTIKEKNLIVTLYGHWRLIFAKITCLLWNFKQRNVLVGISGIKEILTVLYPFFMESNNVSLRSSFIDFDSTLARGLNYYTGTIIEVKAPITVKMGSIGGGGRYDDLTGLFGVPNIAGVGISFGIDRIYDVMEELNLFPESIATTSKAIFFNLGDSESAAALQLMNTLRDNNIACELYPEKVKMEKQFKYADKKNIPFAIIIGSKEVENKTCMVKDLKKGEQTEIAFDGLTNYLTQI